MLAQDSHRDRARSTTEDPNGHVSDEPTRQRKILHIDMDAFFASVEQRDNPEQRGNPVAVGGSCERGVVAAASYEARTFGVRSAMPSVTANRRCPDLIFVKPRFEVYKAVSLQIREIFAEHTPIIEPLSLDEACLDVTLNLKGLASATKIAEDIRTKIRRETKLTASAGSATTNSWRSLPLITASPMASLSSLRKWGQPLWRLCRLPSSMALDRRRQQKCFGSGSQ
jgi:DNA polymerase-4